MMIARDISTVGIQIDCLRRVWLYSRCTGSMERGGIESRGLDIMRRAAAGRIEADRQRRLWRRTLLLHARSRGDH